MKNAAISYLTEIDQCNIDYNCEGSMCGFNGFKLALLFVIIFTEIESAPNKIIFPLGIQFISNQTKQIEFRSMYCRILFMNDNRPMY